ncbi:mitochondrial ornithine carrier protein [Botryosphaeria dothidea]
MADWDFYALQASAERIALDPKYHDALTLVKGVRNGIVYGSKVRFPHALVLRTKAKLVLKATRMHARNLGLFALVYKSTMLLLRRTNGKEGRYDAFLAGLAGGYTVFGRTIHSSVSQQIVIYVFARVVLAYAKLLVQPKGDAKGGHHHHGRSGGGGGWEIISDPVLAAKVRDNGWTVFASVSWALVIYEQSDHWDSLRTLIWHNK